MELSRSVVCRTSAYGLPTQTVVRSTKTVNIGSSKLGFASTKPFSIPRNTLSTRNTRCVASMVTQSDDSFETVDFEASEAEREGWEKRKSEAAEENQQEFGSWEWTLNWNEITPQIVVGSCPRSPGDIDRIVDEGRITSILNLQCDLCFDALKIPIEEIRARAVERHVPLNRVPIRDFDHGDQTLMLPEAVRKLNALVSRGNRVYVHCTAGINRATLTVVGYLTFVQGLPLDEAVSIVKTARSVAHPYIDCWSAVKKRLLVGREEELTAIAKSIYSGRCASGTHGNASTDWSAAQSQALTTTFQRWLDLDLDSLLLEREFSQREAAPALEVAQNALAEAHRVLSQAYKETTKGALPWAEAKAPERESNADKVPSPGNGVSINAASAK